MGGSVKSAAGKWNVENVITDTYNRGCRSLNSIYTADYACLPTPQQKKATLMFFRKFRGKKSFIVSCHCLWPLRDLPLNLQRTTLGINGDSPFVRIFHLQQIIETDVFIVFWLTSRFTFRVNHSVNRVLLTVCIKRKKHRQSSDYQCFFSVGVTGFEPATTRPPDAYSNRAELHPAAQLRCKSRTFYLRMQLFFVFFRILIIKLLILSKIEE